ncbi:hypothetical protein NECAME_19433, partial [Necator americanus]
VYFQEKLEIKARQTGEIKLHADELLSGVFNIPFCRVQPMIPIWLSISGILFIISATLRIYRLIPTPNDRSRSLSLDLCCRGTEGLFLVVNAVWLTLGKK